MKKALVLAGGGTKGIYECGVIRAMREMGCYDPDLIIGVSVGALNAVLLVQDDFDALEDMYRTLSPENIINGFVPDDMSIRNLFNERQALIPAVKHYIKEKGIDIAPFYDFIDQYYNPEKFFASKIDFGCLTAREKDHSGVYVTKEMMREKGKDWLVASASAAPAFPVKVIDGEGYIDGGYYDNFPVFSAIEQGADEIFGIELKPEPIHPHLYNKEHITIIRPHEDLENFLNFDKDLMNHRKTIGYNDAMKKLGRYVGEKYTFMPFALPDFFDHWYLQMLLMESRMRDVNKVNRKIYSDQLITERLCAKMHLPYLDKRQYFYGIMDSILTMIGADSAKIYTLQEALDLIDAFFEPCFKESYEILPGNVAELTAAILNLERTTAVSVLIHTWLYPEHRVFSESMVLTLIPMEACYASFIVDALHLKERIFGNEQSSEI